MVQQLYFYNVEPIQRKRDDVLDVYAIQREPSQRRPAVVLVHGGPVPEEPETEPRDWDGFASYGALLAQADLVAVTFNHRLYSEWHYPQSAEDVAAAVDQVRSLPIVDPDRIGLWFFSGGGALATPWLRERPPWLQAVAFNYPLLAPPPDWPGDGLPFNAVEAIGASPDLPKLLVRVGQEIETLAHTQQDFIAAAKATESALTVLELPHAEHAFEQGHYDARSWKATEQTIRWLAQALLGSASGSN